MEKNANTNMNANVAAANTKAAVATKIETPAFSTNEQLEEQGFKTKSAKIRELYRQGMKIGHISKQVGVIYQHARNVAMKPLKTSTSTSAATTQMPATDTGDATAPEA